MPSEIFAPGLLEGRVVLVTGGGTGLGRAAAAELRACGAEVVISGRRRDVLDQAAKDLGAHAVAGDVREPADAERMVRFALERCGRLDVLVNNAGGQYFVPAEAIEPKGWRAVTRLNVGGTELMARTAAELAFRPGGGGTIVNVTLSPHHGLAGMTHSSAARAAVEGLTRSRASGAPTASRCSPSPPGTSTPSRCASTRSRCGRRRRGPARCSASAGRRSTPGWWPWRRRRSVRRFRAR